MPRTKKTNVDNEEMLTKSQGKSYPETLESGETEFAVKDLPPANQHEEPVKPAEEYADVSEAGKQAAALGLETEETKDVDGYIAGETVVEHPLSPTDANPDPHGIRGGGEPGSIIVTDDNGISRAEPAEDQEGYVEVTGLSDQPVFLGDGRTLAKGQKAYVSEDVAKTLRDNKQAK